MQNQLPPYFQLLRLAWRQYVLRFDIVLWSILLFGLPWFILIDLTSPDFPTDPNLDTASYLMQYFSQPATWLNVGIQLLADTTLIFSSVMIIVALFQTFQRKAATWKEVLHLSRQYYWRALVVSILVGIVTVIGFGAFILPGVVFAIFLSLALPVLVWHNSTVWAAIRGSWLLVKPHWWTVFSYIVMTELIVNIICTVIVSVLPDSLGFRTVGFLLSTIVNAFAILFHVLLFTALDTAEVVPTTVPPQSS